MQSAGTRCGFTCTGERAGGNACSHPPPAPRLTPPSLTQICSRALTSGRAGAAAQPGGWAAAAEQGRQQYISVRALPTLTFVFSPALQGGAGPGTVLRARRLHHHFQVGRALHFVGCVVDGRAGGWWMPTCVRASRFRGVIGHSPACSRSRPGPPGVPSGSPALHCFLQPLAPPCTQSID